jgi:hypothetical protein
VFVLNIELPANVSGVEQLDKLGGELLYRPEGLLFEGGVPMSQGVGPPNEDFVQINLYLHTEGPSGEPLLTFDRVEKLLDRLATELPGEFIREKGEYVEDGATREALEVCWEAAMGRPYAFLEPPALGGVTRFGLSSYPWRDAAMMPGVRCKAIASFNATGPTFSLIRVAEGAELSEVEALGHRFVANVTGRLRSGSRQFQGLGVLFASPGDRIGPFVAEEPTLLFAVDWQLGSSRCW